MFRLVRRFSHNMTQIVTPFTVSAVKQIDYNRIVTEFGVSVINNGLLEDIQNTLYLKSTNQLPIEIKDPEHTNPKDDSVVDILNVYIPKNNDLQIPLVHRFLRRGLFQFHRELDQILKQYRSGTPFYLYTGRGPSSESLHIGHMIPFIFTKWLQDAFDVPVVIQLTDDEKFLFREDLTIEEVRKMGRENAKDIIAFGFNPDKTFIFSDLDYVGTQYPLICQIEKRITLNQILGAFGFDNEGCNIGKIRFPATQAAPAFPAMFPHFFKSNKINCLIPQAIDQDPYFRVTRDIANKLKFRKPACLHSRFIPSLQGSGGKMSASGSIPSSIFLSDTPKEIAKKINKYAFSGGRDTIEEHRKLGGDLELDIPYQLLTYFMEDDLELKNISEKYSSGEMLSGEIKKIAIDTISELVKNHQEKRAKVDDDILNTFMNWKHRDHDFTKMT